VLASSYRAAEAAGNQATIRAQPYEHLRGHSFVFGYQPGKDVIATDLVSART
jgi:hypothetical protein